MVTAQAGIDGRTIVSPVYTVMSGLCSANHDLGLLCQHTEIIYLGDFRGIVMFTLYGW